MQAASKSASDASSCGPAAAFRNRDEGPVTADGFAALMAKLGPFEPAPHLAVAVSGGADSLALTFLADEWARSRGGHVTALTVDHRLRPESADEAVRVRTWLAARGIAHRILVWQATRPATGVQAAARDARYELLTDWCRRAGVLHLLLGHHRGDQAETVMLRQERQSGALGLAAMARVAERPTLRLLRPLLPLSRAQLEATLRVRGQVWLEDPTNRDRRFTRARLRQAMADQPSLIEAAWAMGEAAGRRRRRFEAALARFFAAHVAVHPAGFAVADGGALAALKTPHRREVLGRLVRLVAGSSYGPRGEAVERLSGRFDAGPPVAGATAGGCRLLPARWRGGRLVGRAQGPWLLVVREPAAVAPPLPLWPGETCLWDGRYVVETPAGVDDGLILGALGSAGWQQVKDDARALAAGLPAVVRPMLPAFFRGASVVAVPPLGLFREPALRGASVRFRPRRPLTEAGFAAFSA